MTAEEIKKKDSEYIMHTYGRFDIVLDHGKGATLWDADGKKYVDLTSGHRDGKNLLCKLRCGGE